MSQLYAGTKKLKINLDGKIYNIAPSWTVCIYGSKGLSYTLNDDKVSYSCTGIGTCTDTDIYIAEVFNGLPVTSIGYEAFKKCSGFAGIVT